MARFNKTPRSALPKSINGYTYAQWCDATGLGIIRVPVVEGVEAWIAKDDPKVWAFEYAFDRWNDQRYKDAFKEARGW